MKRLISLILALCLCGSLLAGCANKNEDVGEVDSVVATTPEPTPEPVSEVTPTPEPTPIPMVGLDPIELPLPANETNLGHAQQDVAADKYIDLTNYSPIVSYNGLLDYEREIIQSLFVEYNKYKSGEVDKVSVVWGGHLDPYDNYYRISSFFATYLINYDNIGKLIDFIVRNHADGSTTTEVRLDVEVLEQCLAEKAQMVAKIRTVLSGFTEGTEEHKLQQIADWLKHNVFYSVGVANASEALFVGYGNCNAYSHCFKEMTAQLGIQCDVCVGWPNGKHAWNRVTLSNGEYRFYDITFYYGTSLTKHLNNPNSQWDCDYKINNYWD